jgi:hypothetical protein
MSYESLQTYDFPTVLLVNLADKKSRDFLASMSSDEWSKVTDIVDVSKKGRIQKYLDDVGYPMPFSNYPAAWVLIPKSHTFKKHDDIVCLSNFTNFKQVIDESQWQFVECLIEEFQMSKEYKRQYVKSQILQSQVLPLEVRIQLASLETVELIQIAYAEYLRAGTADAAMEENIKEHVSVPLGQTISLRVAEKVKL